MRLFKRKAKEDKADVGITGQRLDVISGAGAYPDRERNAARIERLETALVDSQGNRAELQAELDRQLKIRELFYSGQET